MVLGLEQHDKSRSGQHQRALRHSWLPQCRPGVSSIDPLTQTHVQTALLSAQDKQRVESRTTPWCRRITGLFLLCLLGRPQKNNTVRIVPSCYSLIFLFFRIPYDLTATRCLRTRTLARWILVRSFVSPQKLKREQPESPLSINVLSVALPLVRSVVLCGSWDLYSSRPQSDPSANVSK